MKLGISGVSYTPANDNVPVIVATFNEIETRRKLYGRLRRMGLTWDQIAQMGDAELMWRESVGG